LVQGLPHPALQTLPDPSGLGAQMGQFLVHWVGLEHDWLQPTGVGVGVGAAQVPPPLPSGIHIGQVRLQLGLVLPSPGEQGPAQGIFVGVGTAHVPFAPHTGHAIPHCVDWLHGPPHVTGVGVTGG
jgi:hypothetical protein